MKKLLLSFGMAALALGASAQETVYLFEDFEWLEPWTLEGVGDCAGTNDPSTDAPQISKQKNADGVTSEAAMKEKGYDFIRDCASSKTPGECIYLQKNYLRFGKTGYQGGIILPSLDIPEGTAVNVSFKWFSQRQGSGVIDPTQLVIKVENGEDVKVFEVPTLQSLGWENDHALEWVTAEIPLTDATVTKDSKISIVNSDDQQSREQRRFILKVTVKCSCCDTSSLTQFPKVRALISIFQEHLLSALQDFLVSDLICANCHVCHFL